MRAAIFKGANQPLEVAEVPTPEPGVHEILVKVTACGVCHTDLHYIDHGVPTFKKPPMILGHEASGIIESVGKAVSNWKAGDRVLLPAVVTCGHCSLCRQGRENICENMQMFGNHRDGSYAEYVTSPAKDAVPMPEDVPLEEGCIIADAISTPYHAVRHRAEVTAGSTVVVVGCGGIGINVVQMAAAFGGNVVAVDIVPEKLELAKKLGAAEVVNASEGKPHKAVKKLLGGGADIAMECIGNPDTISMAMNCLRTGGRLVVVGYSAKDIGMQAPKVMFRELEIRGSLGARIADYPIMIDLVRRGRIKVKELVTGRFPLEKVNDAFDLLRNHDPNTVRSIILPGG